MADTKVYPNTDLRWKLPLRGDSFGTYIFDADQQMIAQSRGWGHLTGGGGLKLDADTAEAIQKARLDEIARRVNLHDELLAALKGMLSFFAPAPGERVVID